MKLLLLYPPDRDLIDTGLPKILEEGAGFSPPLGILYIASMVRQKTAWDVEFIDCAAERLLPEQIRARIERSEPDAIGVTVTTHQLIDCVEIARIAKESDPKIKVIFGGPHVHIYPDETIQNEHVDFVLTGEAEFSIVDLIKSWDEKTSFSAVPGLYFKGPGGVMSGPAPSVINDLDNLPFPDRAISNYRLYTSPLAKKEIVTSMITSRGCPYNCTYCNRPNMGRRFRARSAKNVVDEMQECAGLGIKHIKVYDDTFTIDKKRVLEICDEITRRQIDITWDIRAHVNTVDPDILRRLKQSGCTLICYGVESGSDIMLKRIRKDIKTDRVSEVFKMTRKAHIQTLAYFMLGLPGETREQMLETIMFSKKIKPNYCHFTLLVPFPATPVYSEGLEKGVLSGDYWKEFAKSPKREFRPEVWVENVSRAEMEKLLLKAYMGFYMRFSYIIKQILDVRSFGEFKRKFLAGLRLFRGH
jgi:radical SAM superfamily enzyme YgiQ (UPF0313 family)